MVINYIPFNNIKRVHIDITVDRIEDKDKVGGSYI